MEQFSETLRALAARVAWLERRQGRAALDPDDFAPAWEPPFAPTADEATLKITGSAGSSSDLYSAVEVYHNQSLEGWTTLPGGIEVPAYQLQEVNGITGIPNDKIVRAWPTSGADGAGWAFQYEKLTAGASFSGIRVTTTNTYGPTLGVKVTWTTTGWNVGGYTLSATKIFVPDTTKYLCGFYLPYQMNTGTAAGMLNYYIRASVVANGGSTASGQIASDRGVANADYRPLHAVGEASLAAGDYLELYVTTTDPAGASAGELSIDVPCQFWVTRLG